MQELGEYLKSTRISRGVSIEEASDDLGFTVIQLQNIEIGNNKAFKDVYSLRDYVKEYAKYLGLDADKVIDEFNDFLFEHTSRISLDDIKLETNGANKKEKKIISPYTKIKHFKFNLAPIVLAIVIILLVSLIIYILLRYVGKNEKVTNELKSSEVEYYELT